jgi:hypothetical protein
VSGFVYDSVSSCMKDEGQDRGCGPTPHPALPSGGSKAYSHPSDAQRRRKEKHTALTAFMASPLRPAAAWGLATAYRDRAPQF